MHCRAAVASFLEDEATKRLLVYIDGKDLGAVSGMAGGWLRVCAQQQRHSCLLGTPISSVHYSPAHVLSTHTSLPGHSC